MTPSANVGLYSQIYRQITGETTSDLKRAQQVAHMIEEEIIANNWVAGRRIGAEADISERFQVGRCSAREAIRILQLRGSIRSQRGPGGGLEVAALARPEVLRSICSFFAMIGLEHSTVVNARRSMSVIAARIAAAAPRSQFATSQCASPAEALPPAMFRAQVMAHTNNAALLLLNDCTELLADRTGVSDRDTPVARNLQRRVWSAIERRESANATRAMTLWCDEVRATADANFSSELGCLLQENPGVEKNHTFAEVISIKLAKEIRLKLRQGDLVGSEMALQERYQTGRVVMRQAIRMIEESGLAFNARGRGRGLIVSQPSPGPTSRLLCTYLAQQSVPLRNVWTLMREIDVEQARLAASTASEHEREQLCETLNSLSTWNGPFETLPIADAETAVTRCSHNPILELFVQSTRGYCMWMSARNRGNTRFEQGRHLEEYRSYARAVLENIKEGNSDAAAEAEWTKHEFLSSKVWPTRSMRR